MEGLDGLIYDLALILIVAGLTTVLFKKINQPVVLGYIVAGFLTSPNFIWMLTITDGDTIKIWGDIGIVFLMFALGLEFSFHKIAKVGGSAIITAITVMTAMIFVGIAVGNFLGWDRMDCIFLGGMISMSSTMIILKAYEELDLKKEKFAGLVLGTLVLEDIAGIFMMIILTTISVSKTVSGFFLFKEIGVLLLMLVTMLAVGIYVVPSCLKKIDKLMNNETLLIVSIAFCLGMVVLACLIGFSSALGAFLAGSIIAGTQFSDRIEKMIIPIKDLFGAIFFVSVGMMVVPHTIVEYIGPILIITMVTILGQMLFSTLGALFAGQSLHTSVRVGFSMVQVGEFSFILATLGSSLGVTKDFLYPIVVCVSVITTFTTPIFIKSGEKVYLLLQKKLPNNITNTIKRYTSEKRNDTDKDRDWSEFISKTIIRLTVCTGGMFVIFQFSVYIIKPLFSQYLHSNYNNILLLIITLLALLPFINLLYSRKRVLFTKLWLKNNSNRVPLLFFDGLKIGICIFFIMTTIIHYIGIAKPIAFSIGMFLVLFIIKTDFMNSQSLAIETRFIANFNEKIILKAKAERHISGNYNWVDERLFVVKYSVKEIDEGIQLKDIKVGRTFGLMIIQLIRDKKKIILPNGFTYIMTGDEVVAIGTKNQVESYVLHLQQSKIMSDPEGELVTLREYINLQAKNNIPPNEQILYCVVPVTNYNRLAKKTIKDSGFMEEYKGIIIGIERGDFPIIHPEKTIQLLENDLLWVLGTQKTVNLLLKKDMLQG